MDEREAGAEEDADCIPHTSVPLAWTRVDRVIARRMRTQRKVVELEYLVKWQVRVSMTRLSTTCLHTVLEVGPGGYWWGGEGGGMMRRNASQPPP